MTRVLGRTRREVPINHFGVNPRVPCVPRYAGANVASGVVRVGGPDRSFQQRNSGRVPSEEEGLGMRLSWRSVLMLDVSVVAPPRWIAAQQKVPSADCPAVQGDPGRRVCPDRLVKRSELGEPIPAGNSKWFTASFNDATDNSRRIVATLPASRRRSGRQLPQLNVRCKGNQLNTWVESGQSLASGRCMTFRLDDRWVGLDWQLDSDHKALFRGRPNPSSRRCSRRTFYGSSSPEWPTPDCRGFCSSRSGRTLGPLLRACGL